MINWRIVTVAMLLPLAGCDIPILNLPTLATKPTVYRTVSYYNTHPVERDQTNAWCGDNPGLAASIPTCGNADQAGILAFNRKMGFTK